MGDLVGQAVAGTLYYAPYAEFERVRTLDMPRDQRAAVFANMCRLNALYMIARAGSGHIGSSFSSLDIISWLLLEELKSAATPQSPGDVFFSSKGHDAPGYYSALIGLGRLPFDLIHKLRRLGGLPGHPDVSTPGIATNTGSLGMGLSKAKGMVFANRLTKRPGRVFVMTGDGELQEGQFWESLISAANHGIHEITAIVDHNKLQSDTFVKKVSDLGDVGKKLRSFGWHVSRCDGHDLKALAKLFLSLREVHDRPKIIIADTVKGRGVSFMEHSALDSDVDMYKFHSGAPDEATYARAAGELIEVINAQMKAAGAGSLAMELIERPRATTDDSVQRLVRAYSDALVEQARRNLRLVALDADLVLDTGLIPFSKQFPDRFIECGIAEQDMASQAGGMALKGLLPVVHSFACFLSSRPNEQIYNNVSERTKIIYVGSLAGVLPGGPGHSHQAVRDIATLAAVPGLTLIEPSCEEELRLALDFCLNGTDESCYLRLVSIPCQIPYRLPGDYRLVPGRGVVLREGRDAVLMGYGPIMLPEAFRAADLLQDRYGISATIVNLPWLNRIDTDWLAQTLRGHRWLFTLDNHYLSGGQGERIAACIAEFGVAGLKVRRFGVAAIPECGLNQEVLRAHGLDAESLATAIGGFMRIAAA